MFHVEHRYSPWMSMHAELRRRPRMEPTIFLRADLDLAAPIFWVEKGPLDRKAMRSR
jgi:hypothetical protein